VLARYRLRFLLQEIDLPPGETLVGRSASCHVTIEDPLVSRQHARIRLEGERATVEDLGSRNGLQVNGRNIRGVQELKEGDRLRIGTQELVFCTVAAAPGRVRQTGFMCHCAACGLPYPAELVVCPSCGSNERTDEDTLSGVIADSQRRNWTLELLVEVMQKALSLERWDDVERMLKRARSNVDDRIGKGAVVDRPLLDEVAEAASLLSVARADPEWSRWLLGAYAALGLVPRLGVGHRLSTLPPAIRASLAPDAARVIESVAGRGRPGDEDREGFLRIESLSAQSDPG